MIGNTVNGEEDLLNLNRRVVELADRIGRPVVATTDAHYMEPEDYIYRDIIMKAHKFKEISGRPSLYMRTTDEMLEEFA